MFYDSTFNRDISNWDTSNVVYMNFMFWGSTFNGDISKWNVRNVRYWPEFNTNSDLLQENIPLKFR
jgi:surface protein